MRRLPEPRSEAARARERLARAVALDRLYGAEMNAGGQHLVRHVAFSSYLTLVQRGLADEARRLIAS